VRALTLLSGVLVLALGTVAPAQTKLQTKVFTSTPDGYNSTSTLIFVAP
jgi:hypothetical protein